MPYCRLFRALLLAVASSAALAPARAEAAAQVPHRTVVESTDTLASPRLGWKRVSLPRVELEPASFGYTPTPHRAPPGGWAALWSAELDRWLDAKRDSLWLGARSVTGAPLAGTGTDGVGLTAVRVFDDTPAEPEAGDSARMPGALGEYADLGIRIRGRSDFGGSWDRVQPCTATATAPCENPLLPRIAPETQLSVVAQGTVLDRVHVAVDYDAAREFDASNQIRLFYEGARGEFLQRFEIGDVSLRLPSSRFLTQNVPAGNWGFRATGRAGPLELQALWARQGGQVLSREFRHDAAGESFDQQSEITLDDSDYSGGQFFFLFDPALIDGYPHVDVLSLTGAEAPRELVARGGQLYRYSGGAPAQDGSTVLLRAVPREPGRGDESVTGPFRLLEPGVDYQLHRSGIWVALSSPLREDEALAVSYVTAAGDTIGDLAGGGAGAPAEARLLRGTRSGHRPGSATWPLEMRQIYRVSGGDAVDLSSLRLVISLGEASGGDLGRRHPSSGEPLSYLRLFGLDDDPPLDELDAANLYDPATSGADLVPDGVFIVFPTLRPFAEPPPLPGAGLSDAETAELLGSDANAAVYEAADDRVRNAAARFRLRMTYTTHGQGPPSTLSLGAVGVREGSERITVGGRLLERGVDYDILYDVGQVEFRNPAALFAGRPDAEIRATFEQKPMFGIAPTEVIGLTARYPLGTAGELSFVGLSQQERSLVRRPTLGLETASTLLGGINGRVALGAAWLDRLLDGLPARRGSVDAGAVHPGDAPKSQILVSGELAMSLPDPSGGSAAYLDDFQDRDDLGVPLSRQEWRLGSAPASRQAAEDVLPTNLDAATASPLVWQHGFLDGSGRVDGRMRAAEIDSRIRVTGADVETPILYLTFGGAGAAGSWRSITHVLSATGRDLRTQDYLEFYARGGETAALVLDLGTVSEDAFALDAAGATGGTDATGAPWGQGVLDREWDSAREAWTGEVGDQRGLWNAECRAEPGATYARGDSLANCTRNNGLADTEDLNGNGVLDTDERVLRWVVRLDDPRSPYLVRDTAETGTGFRLFRIPLDRATAIGTSATEIRDVRHLRLTVAGAEPTTVALARLRIVGSGWEKRGEGGIMGGLLDADRPPQPGGRLEVGNASTVSEGDEYVSPPGIVVGAQDPASALSGPGGAEFNERSLRLRYSGIAPGDRVELFQAYTGEPRNFLVYRQLRVWALPREGRWGAADGEQLVIRVGSGPGNHYLYRTSLREAGAPSGAGDWEPEIVIEFSRWLELRAEAERRLLAAKDREASPLVVWDADSTYAVVITERGRAPNLAAVREISIGVWNGGVTAAAGEVWVDDIRLSGAERRPGMAGEMRVHLQGGDLLYADVSYSGRGGHFRQLSGDPTYQDDSALEVNTSLQLGAFLPPGWRMDAPLRVRHRSASADPIYVEGTDLEVATLGAVRSAAGRQTEVQLEVGRDPATDGGWSALDGLRLGVAYRTGDDVSAYTAATERELSAFFEYRIYPERRSFPVLLGVERWSWLPAALRGLSNLRMRWTPVSVSFRTAWSDREADYYQYTSLLLNGETTAQPRRSAWRRLVQEGSVGIQPFPSITGDVTIRTARDLLPSARLNPLAAELLESERLSVLGLDLGREADRSVSTRLAWAPDLASWITARTSVTANFAIDHNPSYVGVRVEEGDTVRTLLRSFGQGSTLSTGLTLDPALLGVALGAMPKSDTIEGARGGGIAAVLHVLGPVELDWGRTLDSRYDRSPVRPGAGYQLGWGSREDLRFLGGDSATLVSVGTDWSARTSIRLSTALTLDVAYGRRRSDLTGDRTGIVGNETDWPNLTAEWREVPVPAFLKSVLGELALSAGYRRSTTRRADRTSGAARSTTTTEVPAGITVRWIGGPTASYRTEWRREAREAPYSATERTGIDHAFAVRHTFPAPHAVAAVFPEPLSLSLRYAYDDRRECRLTEALTSCSARNEFVDYGDQTLGLQLETHAAGMGFGVQLDYHDRQSRIGERIGNSRLTLGIFGEFDFSAGSERRANDD